MELAFCTKQMNDQAEMIRALVENVSEEQAAWKPDSETWSMLQVMDHLYREERGDFRLHLTRFPSPTGEGWPPIDKPGDVASGIELSNLSEVLQGFLGERRKSIVWLQSLDSPDWDARLEVSFVDTTMSFSMGEMLASWVAHDLLHIRQLVELHWAFTVYAVSPYKVDYAGGW